MKKVCSADAGLSGKSRAQKRMAKFEPCSAQPIGDVYIRIPDNGGAEWQVSLSDVSGRIECEGCAVGYELCEEGGGAVETSIITRFKILPSPG